MSATSKIEALTGLDLPKRHYCFNCGEDIGPWDRFCERYDTCGKIECEHEARSTVRWEREEAHEQLDRDMGWY